MQASGLALPAASVADLAALAGLDEPAAEADAAPTMMSREARALFAAGEGEAGLRAWKVRRDRSLAVLACASMWRHVETAQGAQAPPNLAGPKLGRVAKCG